MGEGWAWVGVRSLRLGLENKITIHFSMGLLRDESQNLTTQWLPGYCKLSPNMNIKEVHINGNLDNQIVSKQMVYCVPFLRRMILPTALIMLVNIVVSCPGIQIHILQGTQV